MHGPAQDITVDAGGKKRRGDPVAHDVADIDVELLLPPGDDAAVISSDILARDQFHVP